jgi:DNA-binding Xre family transcriptional regulator
MGFNYRPLFVLMAQKGMKKKDLMAAINTAPATIAKLEKGEYISGEILEKLCAYFDCQPGAIMEYVKGDTSEEAKNA